MKFEDFKNYHAGETIVVCGLGESLNLMTEPTKATTIGVNDIGRKFHPDYLINVNNRNQYKDDRFQFIEGTQANYLLTHVPREQGAAKAPIVEFKIQSSAAGVEVIDSTVPHFRTTPYLACSIAHYMGARRIGLIGVDFGLPAGGGFVEGRVHLQLVTTF